MDYVKSIKGVGVKNYISFIKETFGEEGFQKFVNSLDEQNRKILTGPIYVNNWFDIEVMVAIQKAMVTELGNGDESILINASKWNAKHALRGVYRIFFMVADPGFIIKRASALLKTHFGQEAKCELEEIAQGNVKATIWGFKKHHWPVEVGIVGWLQGTAELIGVKKADIRVSTSLREGKDYFEIRVTWEK
jgi:hypothetical protein